jgi:hypothetical protein
VERYADIAVNGHAAKRVYFRNTFEDKIFCTNVIDAELGAGVNAVSFPNSESNAPDIEKIRIATP